MKKIAKDCLEYDRKQSLIALEKAKAMKKTVYLLNSAKEKIGEVKNNKLTMYGKQG